MPFEALTDVSYTTSATAVGGREGTVKSEDGVIDLPLGKPGSVANPKANPESLFAAGYAACFNSALLGAARQRGLDITGTSVTAKVSLGSTETGFGIAVDLVAHIVGVGDGVATELLAAAHQGCPYSKATRGNIAVTMAAKG